MNKNKLAWIIAGLLTVIILVGGVWYYKKKTANSTPSSYLTGEVKRGNISKTINATGTIQFPSQYNLSFTGKGKITKVNVAVGDSVKAGQVLAEIDSTAANQQVLQAKASLTQAQIKLDQLKAGATQADL
ncbi:MAG TPA: biotin/lipoyl-binding protein, partial [Verrucomicrobiae bacterium]|nr:biotin/lipoyl-binding protein [Verrucomicrobiae bacterium]